LGNGADRDRKVRPVPAFRAELIEPRVGRVVRHRHAVAGREDQQAGVTVRAVGRHVGEHSGPPQAVGQQFGQRRNEAYLGGCEVWPVGLAK
jgi:hypothetical protein